MGISWSPNYIESPKINNDEKNIITIVVWLFFFLTVFNRRFIRDRALGKQMEGIITFRDILLLKGVMRGTVRVD